MPISTDERLRCLVITVDYSHPICLNVDTIWMKTMVQAMVYLALTSFEALGLLSKPLCKCEALCASFAF